MRFIAVYEQGRQRHSLRFSSPIDAMDFLFWGYEDYEIKPCGLYDCLTDQVTLYTHAGKPLSMVSPDSIRTTVALVLGACQPADKDIQINAIC